MLQPEADVRALPGNPLGLLRVAAAWRQCPTATGPDLTRHDPEGLRPEPTDLWQSADPSRAARRRRPDQPPARRAAHARGGVARPGGHALPAHSWSARVLYQHPQSPARSPGDGARSGLGGRHYLPEGRQHLAVPGRGPGSVFAPSPGLAPAPAPRPA